MDLVDNYKSFFLLYLIYFEISWLVSWLVGWLVNSVFHSNSISYFPFPHAIDLSSRKNPYKLKISFAHRDDGTWLVSWLVG